MPSCHRSTRLHRTRYAVAQPLETRQLLAASSLDSTFNDDGIARGYPGFFANDVALQLDGKSVMAGRANGVAAVIRYNVDGSLDTGFGINGLAQLPLMSTVKGVAIDHTSGAILVCSTAHADEDVTHPAVGRLTSGGALDTGFGNGGYAIYDVVGDNEVARDIVIQRDHKIVIVGETNDHNGVFSDPDRDLLIMRLTQDGQRDNTFDGDGVVTVGFGGILEYGTAVAIDYTPLTTDPKYGSIYFAGYTVEGPGGLNFAVGKLTPSGSTDNSFDGDGKAVTGFGGSHSDAEPEGITVQPGSKVVVTGTLGIDSTSPFRDFITARYTPAGVLDPTFGPGANGYVQTDFGGNDSSYAVATNFDGGLTVVGQSDAKVAIASYTPNGVLDPQFNGNGKRIYSDLGLSAADVGIRMDLTGTDIAPARRIVVSAGNDGQAARIVDVAPIISFNVLDGETSENAGNDAIIRISRTNARPVPQRVYLTTTGIAKAKLPGASTYDYTSTNITFGNGVSSTTFIDIPAGATYVDAVIRGFDDAILEGDEVGTLGLIANQNYEIGTPASASFIVRDNEAQPAPSVTGMTFQYDTLPLTVSVTFSQNVGASISPDDFVIYPVTIPTPTLTWSSNTNTATLTWAAPIPDGLFSFRALASGIYNAAGVHPTVDGATFFGFLRGDANHDGKVDFADLVILAQNYGKSEKTFSQGNFDYSPNGKVDFADLVLLAQRYGTSLSFLQAPGAAGPDADRQTKRTRKVDDVLS